MNRPKFTAGFNHGQRSCRGMSRELSVDVLGNYTPDFQAGYSAGRLVGPIITCAEDATKRLNEAWDAIEKGATL
jgi:hypothetical protein